MTFLLSPNFGFFAYSKVIGLSTQLKKKPSCVIAGHRLGITMPTYINLTVEQNRAGKECEDTGNTCISPRTCHQLVHTLLNLPPVILDMQIFKQLPRKRARPLRRRTESPKLFENRGMAYQARSDNTLRINIEQSSGSAKTV